MLHIKTSLRKRKVSFSGDMVDKNMQKRHDSKYCNVPTENNNTFLPCFPVILLTTIPVYFIFADHSRFAAKNRVFLSSLKLINDKEYNNAEHLGVL